MILKEGVVNIIKEESDLQLHQNKGRYWEISRVEGNLVLVEFGHCLVINPSTGSGSGNPSLLAGKD